VSFHVVKFNKPIMLTVIDNCKSYVFSIYFLYIVSFSIFFVLHLLFLILIVHRPWPGGRTPVLECFTGTSALYNMVTQDTG